ncbi:MAG: hypothetical protein Q4C47_01415 [Planctomycetia bacterium]|nr:hypothetical protein [Planctomycetia bacterium]
MRSGGDCGITPTVAVDREGGEGMAGVAGKRRIVERSPEERFRFRVAGAGAGKAEEW